MVRALTIKFIPKISPIAMGEDSGALVVHKRLLGLDLL